MIPLNAQTLQLASYATGALVRAIPKSQLAKLGLTRVPFLASAPVLGAAVGGAAVVALAVPQSRQWLLAKGKEAVDYVRQSLEEGAAEVEKVAENPVPESAPRAVNDTR